MAGGSSAPRLPPDRQGALARRVRSFGHAFGGIGIMFGEPSFRIQLSAGVIVLIAAAVFRVSAAEWLALILVSLAVLVMEMLNTVLEAVVNLASPGYSPLARRAKDVAAGAVLVTALGSVIVGVYIFGPRILHLLR